MKKFLKQFVIVVLLMNLALTLTPAFAGAMTPIEKIQEIGKGTKLPDYFSQGGEHPDASPYLEGVSTVSSPILFALDLFRYVVSGIALVVVFIAAIRLIFTAAEDEATKSKQTLIIGVMGLLVIQLADVVVKRVFFGEQGEAFEDVATAKLFAEEGVSQLRGLIGFVEAFVAAVAVFVIILRGFMLVTSAGDEEEIGKAKTHILYATAGLIIIGLAELVVMTFIFPNQGEKLPDINAGKQIIVSLTNYVGSFVALLSFVMLFYAGYRYVVSGGNEEETEKVKKIALGSLIALLLALGTFALVSTFIKLEDPVNSPNVSLPESD